MSQGVKKHQSGGGAGAFVAPSARGGGRRANKAASNLSSGPVGRTSLGSRRALSQAAARKHTQQRDSTHGQTATLRRNAEQ